MKRRFLLPSLPLVANRHLLLALMGAAALGFSAAGSAAEYDCLIEARQMVEIRSPVEGLIESLPVERGDPVRKGQVLVSLESGPERAAVDAARSRAGMEGTLRAAEARLELTRRKLERAEELYKKNFISSTARDEADTDFRLAQSQLREAQENRRLAEHDLRRATEVLNMRTIRSPFNGVVVDRFLSPGEFAATDSKHPILKLAELDPLNVEVILPVKLMGSIRPGSQASVAPENTGGQRYSARVKIVDRVVDAASGTFGVRLELPNRDHAIPAGVKCKVNFE